MSKQLLFKAKHFPKTHLALAGSLISVAAVALGMLPSSQVEATRTQISLIQPTQTLKPASTLSVPAERALESSQEATTILTSEPSATALQNAAAPQPLDLQTSAQTDSFTLEPNVITPPGLPSEESFTLIENSPLSYEPKWIEYKVRSGDNLTKLFKRAGLGARDVHYVSQADKQTRHLRSLRPGQTVALVVNDGELEQLKIVQSRLESVLFSRTDDGYSVEQLSEVPETRTRFVSGTIVSSLYLGAQQAGLSDKTTMELADIFAWDIDFALDIRKGDQFRVLFEERYLDGERIGEGAILAAEFTNNGDTFAAVRYEYENGDTEYFTPDGRSMKKAFLRSPVDFRRISSNFNPSRYHPVLGIKRPHRGTDYAAATGTPIKASGDGKVIWRGTKGGYGKTIILQHGGNITTLYAHMSKYHPRVSSGTRVKQGQIIGYVGKTGTATGPHLHYEFRVAGVHKNPMTVKLPDAEPIAQSELARFKAQTGQLIAELQRRAVQQLASLN